MAERPLIDITPEQDHLLRKIIQHHIPDKPVWAYGSRVNGTSKPYSDLDLVVFDIDAMELEDLKEGFAESDLSFSVDVMNWEEIPENFKDNIQRHYVVLQEKSKFGGWKECKLGDVATFQRGFDITKKEQVHGIYPVVSSSGIKSYHKSAKTKGPGITIGRKGTLGTVFYLKTDFWPHDTTLWVKNFHGNLPSFIYYFLKEFHFELFDVGSSNPTLNRNHIHLLPASLPPLPEQKAIASVLSSLDDKIDLLHRQNKTLEAMAETLFRQWFVEEAQEDWEEVKLGSLVNISSGRGLKKEHLSENGAYPVLGENGEIGRTNEFLFDENLLFTGRAGTLGNILRVENKKVWLSDNTLVIKPKSYFNFVYFVLTAAKLEEYNVGSTQPLIRQSDIKEINMSLPSESKLNEFEKKSALLLKKVQQNKSQICTLEKLRDTLLPKLMSGEVRVETSG